MRRGLSSFERFHSGSLIYNTCWEDPRIDREALNLSASATVTVITSAGCNAFDYLLAGAGRVIAIDINPRQNARIIWRSAGLQVDFVDPLEVRIGKTIAKMRELITYKTDLAKLLHQKDRVHTYGNFYIAELNAA